jgi:hypothetical protein
MQVNIENIYNSVLRIVIFKELCDARGAFGEHCPLYQVILWWTLFFFLPAWAACGGVIIIESSSGMRQGDFLGGLLFALAHY